ncbi:MAG: hypothetical protein ACXABY_01825 [Candidatus Thorarchaeota archaeon]|jgi:hypothetical protein
MNRQSNRFYQVYQSHSPSGGISPVDNTRYDTLEEARGAAEALMSEVSEFTLYNVGGQEITFPSYWPQPMSEKDGLTFIELQ